MQTKLLRVLLVEDNADDAELTRRALSANADPCYQMDRVACLSEGASRLRAKSYDAVLLDLGLPESVGIETVAQFCARCPNPPPLIVLTGLDDQRTATDALDNGAQDYLIKSDIRSDTLSHSIRNAMHSHKCMAQLQTANDMLKAKNQRLSELYDTAQQFVDNVSHEFRTPLTVIREFTSIIRDGLDGPVNPKQIEHLDKVLQRSDDLALMVDDMLDTSKLEAGLMGVWRRPVHVSEMIATVIGSLRTRAESQNIQLTRQCPADLPKVFCDEDKAQRVLTNLAVNAIKFIPDGGNVEIWARPADDGETIIVGVTDSGPGISPENLEIIFQRFKQLETNVRASTKGFGLGLNIAAELVDLNLGKMSVASELGKGSTFSFTLPRNDCAIVFDRYANRLVALTNTLSEISFVLASVDAQSNKDAAPVVDEYLQRSVRSQDLVIQTTDCTWLVVASCPEQEVASSIDRLSRGWQDYSRNLPGGELPALHLAHCGTWPLSVGLNRLREEVRALCDARIVERPVVGTVVIVDDDQEVCLCLRLRLELAGYKVIDAHDGEQGLAATIEYRPDAVVLDIRMPKMDGITMLREMRSTEQVQRIPVVMLSANTCDQHRALEAGANFFVAKPYEANEVLSAIQTSLNEVICA